jgi:ABC-type sugar transport system permease subunit
MATIATPGFGERLSLFADRRFKYVILWPAVLVLLLIGVFPLVYTLIVSFQHITMMAEDTSFSGFVNYARLFQDARLWAGDDPQTILDDVAAQWDAATDQIGVDAQRAAYSEWAGKPNAYPTN